MTFILIGRRSRYRAGTRYFSRGLDAKGNVSNFNETEQIVVIQSPPHVTPPEEHRYSYVQIRGSVPLFWAQVNTLRYLPDLQIMEAFGNTVCLGGFLSRVPLIRFVDGSTEDSFG